MIVGPAVLVVDQQHGRGSPEPGIATDGVVDHRDEPLAARFDPAAFSRNEIFNALLLLAAAAAALALANSPWQAAYHSLWNGPLTFGLGDMRFAWPLHFWINDVLMTFFFLAVGLELRCEGDPVLLFTENETNTQRLWGSANDSPYVKDAFDEYVVHGQEDAVNPAREGTKAAAQ